MGVKISIDKHVSELEDILEMSPHYLSRVQFDSKISPDITQHLKVTGSDVASELLDDWDNSIKGFVKVMPVDFKRMQGYMDDARKSGKHNSEYDIAVEAFDIHLNTIATEKA